MGQKIRARMRSVPIGANFTIDDSGRVYVKIPEMVLHLPQHAFVVNCIYCSNQAEIDSDAMASPVNIADFVTGKTDCDYWFPERS